MSFNPGLDNYTAARDQQRITVATGISNTDATQTLPLMMDGVTGRVLVSAGGSSSTAVYNEVVAGSGTSWTLANTPDTGTLQLYANGQRLMPGAGNDYTLSGAVITTSLSWIAGTLLADYLFG